MGNAQITALRTEHSRSQNTMAGKAPEYLKVAEVAALLRTTRAMIYKSIDAGKLPVIRIGEKGRVLRVCREDVGALRTTHRPAAAGESPSAAYGGGRPTSPPAGHHSGNGQPPLTGKKGW